MPEIMPEITDTFIKVAPDSPAMYSMIPTARGEHKTVPVIQYELLTANPYSLTLHELIFEVFVQHKNISSTELEQRRDELWNEIFRQPQPCMRTSSLPKKYGWGVHYDHAGKIALYALESEMYQHLSNFGEGVQNVQFALRSKRA